MTTFQKAAILVVRVWTFVMVVSGFLGLAEAGYLTATGYRTPYMPERVVAGIVWLVVGGVGIMAAPAIGRWLGRGLG